MQPDLESAEFVGLPAYQAECERQEAEAPEPPDDVPRLIRIPMPGTGETLEAEVHDGELRTRLRAIYGSPIPCLCVEDAVNLVFSDLPLVERVELASNLLASICDELKAQAA